MSLIGLKQGCIAFSRRGCTCLPSPVLEVTCISLLMAPSSTFKASSRVPPWKLSLISVSIIASLTLTVLPLFYKETYDQFGPTQIIQDNLLMSIFLTSPVKSPFCKARYYLYVLRIRILFCLPHILNQLRRYESFNNGNKNIPNIVTYRK